jgi:hypothetical protein
MFLLFGDCCTYSIFWSTHPVLDWFYPHFRTVYTSQWLPVKPLFWCACWWYPINNSHCIPIYMYIYIWMFAHTHTRIHTHTYIYTHTYHWFWESPNHISMNFCLVHCFLLKSHVILPFSSTLLSHDSWLWSRQIGMLKPLLSSYLWYSCWMLVISQWKTSYQFPVSIPNILHTCDIYIYIYVIYIYTIYIYNIHIYTTIYKWWNCQNLWNFCPTPAGRWAADGFPAAALAVALQHVLRGAADGGARPRVDGGGSGAVRWCSQEN